MVRDLKVTTSITDKKDLGNISILMERGMKVIILMESNMVWVSIFSLMENVTKVNTSKASKMAKELTFI